MKNWVMTATVEPPSGVISARSGVVVMFVSYSRFLRQWYLIYPGGEEKIAEPEMLLLDEEWVRDNPAKTFSPKSEKRLAIRRKREDQLLLF